MGETLAETRLEAEAQRAELGRTAEELRARVGHALDVRARFRENPALFIGLGAGAAFLLAGGPMRVARGLRRRLNPTTAEQAYDALPKALQSWVDAMAGEVGPRTATAREALVEELQRWRQEPLRNRKARRELAKAMAEGPPGPRRTAWRAAETALTLVSGALARRAIEAFITGERPIRSAWPQRPAATRPSGAEAGRPAPAAPADAGEGYSGFSSRGR